MDYDGVDIVVVLDSNGNVDAVYTPYGREKVAVLDWHYDGEDKIRDSTSFVGMPRDAQEKLDDLLNRERRHYHIGREESGDFHLYQDLELALVNLKEHLEEADAKSGKRFAANWVIFACADACEGIE
jgi:hypothetical protein